MQPENDVERWRRLYMLVQTEVVLQATATANLPYARAFHSVATRNNEITSVEHVILSSVPCKSSPSGKATPGAQQMSFD